MKRPGYREAIAWIAENDSAGDDDPLDVLDGLVTVCLVADLFRLDNKKVAADVFQYRQKQKQQKEVKPQP